MKGRERAASPQGLIIGPTGRLETGFRVPTTEGRKLLVRPGADGSGVQVATIGKRGGLVEASMIGLEDVPGFIFAVDRASEIAWGAQEKCRRRERRELERRHKAALERNPWLRKAAGGKVTVRGW